MQAITGRLPDLLAQVLDELVGTIVRHFCALHKLLDAFALLDLLTGFAAFAAAAEHTYVRPQLTETGCTMPPLALVLDLSCLFL